MAAAHRAQAREMIAAEVEKEGPAWRGLADSIRGGFTNLWLEPSLRAVERALAEGPDDAED